MKKNSDIEAGNRTSDSFNLSVERGEVLANIVADVHKNQVRVEADKEELDTPAAIIRRALDLCLDRTQEEGMLNTDERDFVVFTCGMNAANYINDVLKSHVLQHVSGGLRDLLEHMENHHGPARRRPRPSEPSDN